MRLRFLINILDYRFFQVSNEITKGLIKMDKVSVIYGSTTGNTESAAEKIAAAFGVKPIAIASASQEDFKADLLILGVSTWGFGDLQDDWESNIAKLEGADLSGVKAAIFGEGDQSAFSDTYCNAMATLAEAVSKCGAKLIGRTSAEGYNFSASTAEDNGSFCGLALDENNQPELTDERISAWVSQLKSE